MIPIYTEQPGNRWTLTRQRRYLRQSNEAEAAGHPYIVIRSRGRSAKIVCDWITSHRPPTAIFGKMVADHMAACWPSVKVECVGVYTVLSRVPISQAVQVAEDIAAMATAYSLEIPDGPR